MELTTNEDADSRTQMVGRKRPRLQQVFGQTVGPPLFADAQVGSQETAENDSNNTSESASASVSDYNSDADSKLGGVVVNGLDGAQDVTDTDGMAMANTEKQVLLRHTSPRERDLQWRYWKLKDDDDQVRCLSCSKPGHMHGTCPFRTCSHCHARDLHMSEDCPLWQRCSKCRERGHQIEECPSKLRVSLAEVVCDICNGNHTEDHCIWKRQSFRPWEHPHTQKAQYLKPSCYNCGAAGHWGDDCPARDKAKPPSGIQSAEQASLFTDPVNGVPPPSTMSLDTSNTPPSLDTFPYTSKGIRQRLDNPITKLTTPPSMQDVTDNQLFLPLPPGPPPPYPPPGTLPWTTAFQTRTLPDHLPVHTYDPQHRHARPPLDTLYSPPTAHQRPQPKDLFSSNHVRGRGARGRGRGVQAYNAQPPPPGYGGGGGGGG